MSDDGQLNFGIYGETEVRVGAPSGEAVAMTPGAAVQVSLPDAPVGCAWPASRGSLGIRARVVGGWRARGAAWADGAQPLG